MMSQSEESVDSSTLAMQPRSGTSMSNAIGQLAFQSSAGDNHTPSPQEDGNESVSRTLVPLEVVEKKSRDRAWHPISRHVTANQVSSHVDLLEPALRVGLARVAFEGQYMIQVGFNESMLQQGTLLEEIHLLLDRDLVLREEDTCTIFAPIFAPFPGIVFTPGETFYVPIDPPLQGIPGRRLELQGSSSKSGATAAQQGAGASEGTGKGSEHQNKKNAGKDSRSHRKTPDERPNSEGSSNGDDEDDKGKGRSRHDPKGKGRQCGPRVINIPFQSTLLTTGPNGECDQFIISAGFDITVRFS